mmetsp:Transcript_568/g.1090  ORF Transcript_568/g.1090 Transcript_568/m.1090 type:complete len:256 (+) Transcript_568:104-871(+)
MQQHQEGHIEYKKRERHLENGFQLLVGQDLPHSLLDAAPRQLLVLVCARKQLPGHGVARVLVGLELGLHVAVSVQPHVPDVVEDLGVAVNTGVLQGALGVHVELDAVVLLLAEREGHLEPLRGLPAPAQGGVGPEEPGVVLPPQRPGAHVPEAGAGARQGPEALLEALGEEEAPAVELVGAPLRLQVQGLHAQGHQAIAHVPAALVRGVQQGVCLRELQEWAWVFFIDFDLLLRGHDCSLELPFRDIFRPVIQRL